MSRSFWCGLSGFLCFVCLVAHSRAQAAAEAEKVSPTVSFTLDFPESQPEHYTIRVLSSGPGHYASSGHFSKDSEDTDSFDFDFPISAETRARIFALAGKAEFFQKDAADHHKNIAFTGKKTLRYADADRSGETSYNYSANAAVRDLTGLFQNLSATLEFGHRLDYDRRYQKLALNEELKRMQEMAHDNLLVEVAAIQPILQRIIDDQSVINVARARAQQLLQEPAAR